MKTKLTIMLFRMPTISFFIRTKKECSTLFCRVTFNKTKAEFSLKEKINPSDWDQSNQRLTTNSIQKKFVDNLQNSIEYKLKNIAIYNDQFTAKELIQELQPKQKAKDKIYVSEICQAYISTLENLIAPGTLTNHNIKLKNLQTFENKHGKLTTEDFTLKMCNTFLDWFKMEKQTKNITTANRNLLFYKQALEWYKLKGNQINSELLQFKGEKDKIKPPTFLTAIELTRLENQRFESNMLSRIRDLFLFQCYTGLSYCDLWGHWKLKQMEYGTVIIGNRGKNKQQFFIPVDEKTIDLLKKYDFKLPEYCNIAYNRLLKEVAQICNINKRITTHTGRKTFATLMDANGWSRETVSKMLGHKSFKTTEMYYLGESNARIEYEMKIRMESKKAV